jgi:hypothetical protein
MSSLSEEIRKALRAKLNVANVTNLATGGVFYSQAKLTSLFPFLIFEQVKIPVGLRRNVYQLDENFWQIKAILDADSASASSAIAKGEAIIAAALAEIGNSLSITGKKCDVVRLRDIPAIKKQQTDRNIWTVSAVLQISVAVEYKIKVGDIWLTENGADNGIALLSKVDGIDELMTDWTEQRFSDFRGNLKVLLTEVEKKSKEIRIIFDELSFELVNDLNDIREENKSSQEVVPIILNHFSDSDFSFELDCNFDSISFREKSSEKYLDVEIIFTTFGETA